MAFAFLPFFPPCGEILQAIIVIFLLAGEKNIIQGFNRPESGKSKNKLSHYGQTEKARCDAASN